MKKLVVAAAVAALGFVGAASAADMPTKAPAYKAPAVPPVSHWTGWYVGLNAGAGWGNNRIDNSFTQGPCVGIIAAACTSLTSTFNSLLPPQFSTGNKVGFLGGGQIGYNWQIAPVWVTGIEADIQGANLSRNASFANGPVPLPGFTFDTVALAGTASQKIDWLGTLRARLGLLPVDTLLVYATGGLAYGHTQTAASFSGAIVGPIDFFPGATALSQSNTRAGWTVGGGLEWMFAPRWSVKGEYLFYDLGHVTLNQTLTLASAGGPSDSFNVQSRVHYNGNIARAGINYHF
jgi:outer membrane immunogenic protein